MADSRRAGVRGKPALMQIDIALEPGNTPDEVAELGALAERYGIATLWITNDPVARDAFLCLSALARASRRIRVGVMAISPFEMHPLKMANSLLTLNELSGGRASILVGGGGAFLGNARFRPQRRVRAVAECIDILKQASPAQPLTYEGEIYTVRNYHPPGRAPWHREFSPVPTSRRCCAWPRALRMVC